MAATGYTPIYIYYSSTTSNVPSAGNLGYGELAINITDGKLFYKNNANAVVTIPVLQASGSQNGWLSSTDWTTFNNKGSGTVTSVSGTSPVASSGGNTPAISLASGYGDTQNPYASKTANYFLAAPNGSAGAPTFRAIVAADIPTLNQNTSGTAAGLSATLATTSGGTGLTSFTANGIFYASSTSAIAQTSNFTWDGNFHVTGNSNTVYCATLNCSNTNNSLVRFGSSGKIYSIAGGDYQGVFELATESGGGPIYFSPNGANRARVDATGLSTVGSVYPVYDNSYNCGGASNRWATVYAATGSINTSDERIKTKISKFTDLEIKAAKQIAKEIGTYKFLESIKDKGDEARLHIGLTVQKAIEIMESNGLNPFAYGFICYDKWDDKFNEFPAVEETPAVIDENGNIVIPHQEGREKRVEQILKAGDIYSFRYDELAMFVCKGMEERLSALEAKLS